MPFKSRYNSKYDCPHCGKKPVIGDTIEYFSQAPKLIGHTECLIDWDGKIPEQKRSTLEAASITKTLDKDGWFPCPACNKKPKSGETITPFSDSPRRWGHVECLPTFKITEYSVEDILKEFDSCSVEQLEIIKQTLECKGDLIVESTAGSGKTTTILNQCKALVKRDKTVTILVLSFNKAISVELKDKIEKQGLAANVKSLTCHGFGFRRMTSTYRSTVKNSKVWGLVNDIRFHDNAKKNKTYQNQFKKLVGLHKNTGLGVKQIICQFDLDFEEVETAFIEDNLRQVMSYNNQDTATIDFDDMCYLPIALGMHIPYYDFIFVDEAQDLNNARLNLVLKARRGGNRCCFVGDSDQAINGFSGAFSDSMQRIQKATGAKEMTMTVTWRCPPGIVAHINEVLPHVEITSGLPEDTPFEIEDLNYGEFLDQVNIGAMVLCRMNGPLIGAALGLLKRGKSVHIQGKEALELMLSTLIEEVGGEDIPVFLSNLQEWSANQEARIRSKTTDADKLEEFLSLLYEKEECMDVLSEGLNTVSELKARIKMIFNQKGNITLSSVHRSKGLEAEKVYILKPEKLPLYQGGQEQNIHFVALSRTKFGLYYVKED